MAPYNTMQHLASHTRKLLFRGSNNLNLCEVLKRHLFLELEIGQLSEGHMACHKNSILLL